MKQGAPKEKLMIGMPTYGRSFTLVDPTKFDIGAPASGGGTPGKYTGEAGFMSYYEVSVLRAGVTCVEQLKLSAGRAPAEVSFADIEPWLLLQVCDFLHGDNTTLVWDNEQQVPFAYRDDQWVGFDDERSLKTKVKGGRLLLPSRLLTFPF